MTRIVLLIVGMFCAVAGGCHFDEDADSPGGSHRNDLPSRKTAGVPEQVPTDDAPDDEQKGEKFVVKATELFDRVEIIGDFGVPLGKVLTIRGQWRFPSEPRKSDGPVFAVHEVNGRSLAEEVELDSRKLQCFNWPGRLSRFKTDGLWTWNWQVGGSGNRESQCPSPIDGEIWEMQVFQELRMQAIPKEAWGGITVAGLPRDRYGTEIKYFEVTRVEQKP